MRHCKLLGVVNIPRSANLVADLIVSLMSSPCLDSVASSGTKR